MGNTRGRSAVSHKTVKPSSQRKYLAFTLFVIVLLLLFSGVFGLFWNLGKSTASEQMSGVCGDGTLYDKCSSTKPYFCQDGMLVDLPSRCGCPDGFTRREDFCFSNYNSGPKRLPLKYTLDGENHVLDFIVYDGFEINLGNVSKATVKVKKLDK